jgi:alkylation response protein AidB-like acyl-CoA dehydrogenase
MAADYQAPTADYAFLFGEAFGLDIVARATGGELTAADGADVIAGAGEFAASVLAPLQSIGDREGARLVDGQVRLPDGFAEAYAAFVEAGWISGGADLRRRRRASRGDPRGPRRDLERLERRVRAVLAAHAGQIHALDAAASDEIRETYLTKLVSGQWTGTMNLTEPAAGTDLGAIRTIATPRGDGTWRSAARRSSSRGATTTSPRTSSTSSSPALPVPRGAKGLSLFVAPKYLVNADGSLGERNAVRPSRSSTSSASTAPTCVLSYEDATGYLVGEVGGDWPGCS